MRCFLFSLHFLAAKRFRNLLSSNGIELTAVELSCKDRRISSSENLLLEHYLYRFLLGKIDRLKIDW